MAVRIFLLAACIFLGLASGAHAVLIDNLNLPGLVTAGSQATFGVQSFTPNIGGIGIGDTVATNLPLTPQVALTSASFVRAPAGTATSGNLFLDVYLGDGSDGTYLGSSTNSVDINSATALSMLTWNFDSILLNSTTEYALVFSTNNVAGGLADGRVAAANNGAGFVNTYSGGTADNNHDNNSPVAFDARFAVQFQAVPEPQSVVVWGMALAMCSGMCLWSRRRTAGRVS